MLLLDCVAAAATATDVACLGLYFMAHLSHVKPVITCMCYVTSS